MVHAWPIRPRFGLYIYIDVQAEVWRCDSTTLQLWRCDSKTLQLIKYYECHNHPDLWDCNIWQLHLTNLFNMIWWPICFVHFRTWSLCSSYDGVERNNKKWIIFFIACGLLIRMLEPIYTPNKVLRHHLTLATFLHEQSDNKILISD